MSGRSCTPRNWSLWSMMCSSKGGREGGRERGRGEGGRGGWVMSGGREGEGG